jgi:hypothetical protein
MIDDKIIQYVLKNYTRSGTSSSSKIKDFIEKYEPEFFKHITTISYEDVRKLVEQFNIPPAAELLNAICNLVSRAKLEGYLMHSVAQNQFWSHKYGLDPENKIPAEEKFKLFLDGKLDISNYNYKLTDEESKDNSNYKKIALDNFKKHQKQLEIENTLSEVKVDKIIKEEKVAEKKPHIMGDLMD